MEKTLAEILKEADSDLLNEILREAESRLNAQLTTAIAADARAMTFLGFISAVAVATTGAGLAVYGEKPTLGVLALLTAIGFIVAAFFAFEAARPIDFELIGNDPASWKKDIQQRVSVHQAKAEQLAFYDEMIKANRKAMADSAYQLQMAVRVAIGTTSIGGIFALLYVLGVISK
ncbi:hypothetical protein DXM26_22825 [Agrobacterium tumefaciens]|uniref:hypothetical protein n=1 Tax=Agrobacterium tumefaciens TaxID=358 RepID=UPI001230208E|nr:hypothetical protein DXM26_22825 [Agrobacterium tumefaciens]